MTNLIIDGIARVPLDGSSPRVADALLVAMEAMQQEMNRVGDDATLDGAMATLQALYLQRGCEHMDPAVTDGLLTHACDIAIFG